jgi:hypothetical protein
VGVSEVSPPESEGEKAERRLAEEARRSKRNSRYVVESPRKKGKKAVSKGRPRENEGNTYGSVLGLTTEGRVAGAMMCWYKQC